MKNRKRFGFTLMEMLIVVAIIAVLVAIAVPTVSNMLEKSREATDLANVRGAYAQLMRDVLLDDAEAHWDGSVYRLSVPLKQKQEDWQGSREQTIAGISSTDVQHWKGHPMENGSCEITYDPFADNLIFYWTGSNLAVNLGMQVGCWNGGNDKNKQEKNMFSTFNEATKDKGNIAGLYELEGGATYQVSITYNPHYDNPEDPKKGIISKATLLFDETGKNVFDSGTGRMVFDQDLTAQKNGSKVNYRYTKNTDGTITYTATFTTPNAKENYYYGMNFGGQNISSDGSVSGNVDFVGTSGLNMTENELAELKSQVSSDFTLVKLSK